MLLSGRGAPGCAPPGGKSTAGSGGRRTGCAASPPSGQRLAAAGSRAKTSSGPSAESASSLSFSSSSLFPFPSMALNTSRSSPRTSAAVGGDGAVPVGVLALEIVGRRGVEAGEGLLDAPDAEAGAGGPAAGSPGPRWPPAALPPPGACCCTNIFGNTRTAKTFFLAPSSAPGRSAPRALRALHYGLQRTPAARHLSGEARASCTWTRPWLARRVQLPGPLSIAEARIH